MAETTRAGHPLNILLAKDDPVSQRITLQMLKILGYNADTADIGLEALLALEYQPYDTMLMDALMPEVDGIFSTWSSIKYHRHHPEQ